MPRLARLVARLRPPTALEAVLAAYFAVYVLWYAASGAQGAQRTFLSDAAYLPIGAAGAVLAVRSAVHATSGRSRAVWALLALALVARLVGDGSWWWLEAVRGTDPFPSVADVGFTLFYPVLIAALLLMPVHRQTRTASLGDVLDGLATAGGAFLVVWYLALAPAVEAGLGTLGHVLGVSYPVWDLLLLLAAGRLLRRGVDGTWRNAARWLVAGSAAFVVADVGFLWAQGGTGYVGGSWHDLFWVGALLCFALAAVSRPSSRPPSPGRDLPAHLLPIAAAAAGFSVVARLALDLPLVPVGVVLLAVLTVTLVVLARQVVTVADQRAVAAAYRRLATTDAVTGLATRRHFLESAEAMLRRHPGRCALVMADVDHFKAVNDTRGHQAGDRALVAVAAHLRSATRGGDLLGRYGGDEFVLLLVDVDEAAADVVVERLATPSRHLAPDPRLAGVTLSVGWAHGGDDLATLTTLADDAVYAAKRAGRARAVPAADLPGRALVPLPR